MFQPKPKFIVLSNRSVGANPWSIQVIDALRRQDCSQALVTNLLEDVEVLGRMKVIRPIILFDCQYGVNYYSRREPGHHRVPAWARTAGARGAIFQIGPPARHPSQALRVARQLLAQFSIHKPKPLEFVHSEC